MAQPKDAERGRRGIFSVRVGLDHPEWLGINKQMDPGAIQDTEYVSGINLRVSGSYLQERGGQSKDSGPATGCVIGIFDLGGISGPTLANAALLMNGICRAPNAQGLGPYYCFATLTDVLQTTTSGTDVLPVSGVGLGGYSSEYDGVAPAIQVTNQFHVAADGVMWQLANSSMPRVRSFLSSQGKVYIALEPVTVNQSTGAKGSPIATLARASSSGSSTPVVPSPSTYSLQVLFNLPHLAWASCEWNGMQWWIGPTWNPPNYGSIMLSHWDGTNLTTETVIVRSPGTNLAGTNVAIIGFHETLCCITVGQINVRDVFGNYTVFLMRMTSGSFAFYTNAVVEYNNKIYMFGGIPGVDGVPLGQNVFSFDGTNIVIEHTAQPRTSIDGSDGYYDAVVLGSSPLNTKIFYTARTPTSDAASPNDAWIGQFDGTTWTDEMFSFAASTGGTIANFINSLATFNGNLVAGFITGTKGQAFTTAPAGPAGIFIFNPFATSSNNLAPGNGNTLQVALLPWTDAPGNGMNGFPQCPGEFLNA